MTGLVPATGIGFIVGNRSGAFPTIGGGYVVLKCNDTGFRYCIPMANYPALTHDGRCIFCEITSGRLATPGIFWQDDRHMAWLSIDPNTEGYSCVVPRKHFGSDVLAMPDTDLATFILAAKRAAGVLERYFIDVGRVGAIMEGTGIDHAHIKLIPMHGTAELADGSWHQVLSEREAWFERYPGWLSSASGPMADSMDLERLGERLRSSQAL